MNASAAVAPDRQTRGKSEKTRDLLLDAGIALFSEQGYAATSTRQVETHAGVRRNLMTYHFGNKEEFWKQAMLRLADRMRSTLAPAIAQSRDIEPDERIRFLIRRYVRASSTFPEMARIMFDEGRCNSWRLQWLVDNCSRGFFNAVRQLFQDGRDFKVIPDIPLTNFYYLLVGSATIFSMSNECELLTGENALDDSMIDIQADTIAKLLTVDASAKMKENG